MLGLEGTESGTYKMYIHDIVYVYMKISRAK